MRTTTRIAAAAALLLTAPLLAQAEAAQDYMVRLQLSADTALIAQPTVQVHAGEPATLELSGGYSIRLTASPDQAKPGNILLASDITVTSTATSTHTRREQSTTVSLRPEQKMTFDIAPSPGSTDKPIHVELSAAPVAH